MTSNRRSNVRNCDLLKADRVLVKISPLARRDLWPGSDLLHNNGRLKSTVRLRMFVVHTIVSTKGILHCCAGEGIKIEVLAMAK